MNTRFLSVLARVGAKRQHSSLLDAPKGQLQQRARSTKKLRPLLTTPAVILAHFHPLLWLAEALCFNTLEAGLLKKGLQGDFDVSTFHFL